MRLVSLTANSQGFHSVSFNRKGPSLIVGRQKARPDGEKSGRQTYNGVGKSLLLYLINFCFGADAKASFIEQLKGWEFTLRVMIGSNFVLARMQRRPSLNSLKGGSLLSV